VTMEGNDKGTGQESGGKRERGHTDDRECASG